MTVSPRNQVRPKQFQTFLHLPDNKTDLVKFNHCNLINDWSSNIRHSDVLEGKKAFIIIEDQAFCIFCSRNSSV